MIWFVLWCAVVYYAFTGLFTGFMKPDSPSEWFFVGLFYCFIVVVAAGVCGLIAYGVGGSFPQRDFEGPHYKLAVIRTKDGIAGTFFLGSGSIDSQPYYFYYRRLDDGGLRPGKVQADASATVYEEDRSDAEMVVWDWRTTSPIAWLFGIPRDGEEHSYDFHVPKGSVKQGYEM